MSRHIIHIAIAVVIVSIYAIFFWQKMHLIQKIIY